MNRSNENLPVSLLPPFQSLQRRVFSFNKISWISRETYRFFWANTSKPESKYI